MDANRSPVAIGYDAVYEATPKSPTLRRLWRELAAGSDFPEEFLHISLVTLRQLRVMADALALRPGDTFVDLACGMAGPALWVSRDTSANLIGVDISPVAVALAAGRAKELGLSASSRFILGSFDKTGIADASADAAMSEDALQYAPDKGAAFREAARILRPAARFVFTAFELEPERAAGLPVLGTDPVDDYRPSLEMAGFSVERYEEVPGWPEPMRTAYRALLHAKKTLVEEMGEFAAAALFSELTVTLETDPYRRRVLAVARRS